MADELTNREQAWHRFGQRARRAGQGLAELLNRESLEELRTALDVQGFVRKHPIASVAAAVGVGYLFGGGLLAPATRGLVGAGVRIGLRVAAAPFLKEQLSRLIASQFQGSQTDYDEHVPEAQSSPFEQRRPQS